MIARRSRSSTASVASRIDGDARAPSPPRRSPENAAGSDYHDPPARLFDNPDSSGTPGPPPRRRPNLTPPRAERTRGRSWNSPIGRAVPRRPNPTVSRCPSRQTNPIRRRDLVAPAPSEPERPGFERHRYDPFATGAILEGSRRRTNPPEPPGPGADRTQSRGATRRNEPNLGPGPAAPNEPNLAPNSPKRTQSGRRAPRRTNPNPGPSKPPGRLTRPGGGPP